MSTVVAALLSLLSAVVVAFVSHVLAASRRRQDDMVGLRLRAYADFINATSRLVSARRAGRVADDVDELAVLNDAKARLCLCADEAVVRALAEFWEHGGTLERESEILAFTRLCMRIRESLGASAVSGVNISDVLFKLQPSAYSYKRSRETE